jgi:rod shape determining protein RodA
MSRWTRAREHLLRLDPLAVLPVLLLLVIGICFIYSAGHARQELGLRSLYQRQIGWASLGLVLYVAVTALPYSRLQDYAAWFFVGGAGLLLAVLLFGVERNGARSWLPLGIPVQPAELAKISTVLALAGYLCQPGRSARQVSTLLTAGALVLIPFLLVMRQPDFGTACVFIPLALAMLFVAGLPLRVIALGLLLLVALLPLGWMMLEPYQRDRVQVFLDPSLDPRGIGYNRIQAERAVGSGGFAGKGFLEGTQSVLGFLPRRVMPTDFIFAVIAEERGFLGSAALLLLYGLLLFSLARTAVTAADPFGRLLVVGVMAVLFTHISINLSMTVGLLPITGLPLPLVSYGGSFTISTLLGLGLAQSVHVRRYAR